jgi:myosin heavy subunit
MLIRLSLIVAVIAGLAVGALNFIKVKTIITDLRTNLATETAAKVEALNNFHKTSKELEQTKTDLTQTKQTLETTTTERDTAVKTAAAATAKATQLSEDLDNTKKTLGDVQAEVAAYKASGFSPEQVIALSKTLKQSQDALAAVQGENKVLERKRQKLEYELAKYRTDEVIVYLPPSLKGQVTVSDPKWEFVVLNIGEDQGVLQDGELLVNRNGKLVAKVKVTTVQKDRSIANVMPGWKLGDLIEGDQVIPAHPASS